MDARAVDYLSFPEHCETWRDSKNWRQIMSLECPENCGHTDDQHESFDDGYFAGLNGFHQPSAQQQNRESWFNGNSVGILERNAEVAYDGESTIDF
jgi:hypothetical protein